MKDWFSRSPRKQHRQDAAQRRVSAPATRSSRFELLEDRRMLTVDFTTLASFNGADGVAPVGSLTTDFGSIPFLYGMTLAGGANNEGNIFSLPVTGGIPTNLGTFDGTNGEFPYGSLTFDFDESSVSLYGMTSSGGANNDGTVFAIPLDGGTPTTLLTFNGTNGANPHGSLTASSDGSTLYGMTQGGGANGDGIIFSIPVYGSSRSPTTLASFNGTNGANPNGSLTLSSDGSTLYGMTQEGGANGDGTVFSIPVTGGTPTTLLSFNGISSTGNGANPNGSLTLSSDGSTLYGMTVSTIFSIPVTGGTPTILSETTGGDSNGSLTLDGSTLYGMTQYGGVNGDGTIFSIPLDGGTPTTLLSFNSANGANPCGSLTPSSDGSTLYGMTESGGTAEDGTVFSTTILIPPPVVTPSGATNTFTVGGSAVAVDSGVTVSSNDADITGVSMTITNYQSGDALNFTNQNGISGSYSNGVLTLTGSATVAQYQTALQSVTFSTTSTNTTTRSLSIVAMDGSSDSSPAEESVNVAIAVTLSGPKVTNSATTANTQTTSGLVITPGPNDSSAAYFEITYITGGTLYLTNGTTQITNGSFITLAQGEAGLKFTPTSAALVAGGFTIREATTNAVSGLSGPTARAAISVTLAGPSVTGATTTENVQTTSGLVIKPGMNDSFAAYFQITNITGGTLYQNNGTTPITNGSFITLAQGAAGLKFTPTTGSLTAGSFHVQESTTNSAGGLSGLMAAARIAVTLSKPTVTGATTTENTQTTSGLVITPGPNDSSAAYFEITYITGGTLYQHDGTTMIANGSFITLVQAAAGLKFTPNAGSLVAGGFTARQSTTNAVGGLSGPTARAAIAVTLSKPAVINATTTENTQTTSGLAITPGLNDSSAAYFEITYITGGTLYLTNGTTQITNGSFITLAQGEAGLKFTPTSAALVAGGFTIREATTNAVSGLSGPTARAAISVTLAGPSVTGATTPAVTTSASIGSVSSTGSTSTTAGHHGRHQFAAIDEAVSDFDVADLFV